jgi:hypothetical protein
METHLEHSISLVGAAGCLLVGEGYRQVKG